MKKVLVVDDAPANRLVLAALLRKSGYEAVVASGAEEALAYCRAELPDAVLTDLRMPAGDEGLQLGSALRSLPEGAALRLALLTGDASEVCPATGIFDAVLEKPVSLDALKAFLEEEVS